MCALRALAIVMSLSLGYAARPVVSFGQPSRPQPEDSLKQYEIDEVIVTGTRTSKRIIDIPYSVERIDNSQYKYERKVAVNDVLGTIPGLFMQSRYGNHDVRISIRGFGSRSNTGIRGVRILLDGIPESEPDGQTRIEAIDFQSIGRIEIVKGNSSSLYTNAPGGVINFINDIFFMRPFGILFGEFGSFDLRSTGLKTGVRTDEYGFLLTYNRHEAEGYRSHSNDRWNIVNSVLETRPSENTTLSIFTNFVDGYIKLPGSLTKTQFDQDLLQPNARDLGRDAKRITKKGRLGLQFNSFLGAERRVEAELTAYGTMKYFERTAGTYRVFNRNGIGASGRLILRYPLSEMRNEFSIGGDLFYQTGPIEEYENISGIKGDILRGLTDETISNAGFYVQNSLTLIDDKLDLLITGRLDNVVFESKNQILQVQNARREFQKFTPKAALNFKLIPSIAVYTSYGISFDSPAGNEMDNYPTSSNPTVLINPDLNAQKSNNFEAGIKGNLYTSDADVFNKIAFELTFFNSTVKDEIVPFEVFGDVFYRNSAKTDRTGLEVGGSVEIVDGLRLKSAYTYSMFTYDTYTARTIELDTLGNIVTVDRDFAGNTVPSVPKHNLSASVSYERNVIDNVTAFVKGTFNSVSRMTVNDRNSEWTAGYQLLGSTVGFDVLFDPVNILVSGGVNNIADRKYAAFININSASGEFYEAGEPRNFFASINLGCKF